jgi:hypothetical protein
MHAWFNIMGVVVTSAVLIAAAIVLITRDMVRHTARVWKTVVYLAVYVLLQVLTVNLLLNDFAKPSIVDFTALAQIGDTRIEGFEEREAVLRAATHLFTNRNRAITNYRFLFSGNTVHLTIYRFGSAETAHVNLLVAAGITDDEVQWITEKVYGFPAPSVLWRDRQSYTNPNLDREIRTYFVVYDTMFSIREVGNRDRIGEGTNDMIVRLLDVFFG